MFIPNHRPSYILSIAESFFGPLQGFLNCIVYGLSKKIAGRYRKLWAWCGDAKESYYSSDANSNAGSYVLEEEGDRLHNGGYGNEENLRPSPPTFIDANHSQYQAFLNAASNEGQYGHYTSSPIREQPIIAPIPVRQAET